MRDCHASSLDWQVTLSLDLSSGSGCTVRMILKLLIVLVLGADAKTLSSRDSMTSKSSSSSSISSRFAAATPSSAVSSTMFLFCCFFSSLSGDSNSSLYWYHCFPSSLSTLFACSVTVINLPTSPGLLWRSTACGFSPFDDARRCVVIPVTRLRI